ncbi:MAG: DUF4440 domain-containing protein [Calditrichaeota bacterium]|nr:nuclear transport factor 2 family protein [Calditrichota bacterium]RQV99093.1 MAG: DUF4440 domain-containing protein [Calditrichota bacterium]
MTTILDDLVDIEKKCARAFNQNDIDTILNYFSDDISGFSSTEHDRFTDKKELRKTFEYYLSEADEVTYDIMEPAVVQYGDTAVLSFYWRVTIKTGNRRIEIPGRGTHVYHKINDTWKIIHEHFSRAH